MKENDLDDLIHTCVSKDPVGWAPHLFLGVTRGCSSHLFLVPETLTLEMVVSNSTASTYWFIFCFNSEEHYQRKSWLLLAWTGSTIEYRHHWHFGPDDDMEGEGVF